MLVDLHMHSHHSKCAQSENTIAAMVESAVAAGMDGIGITDHLHPHIDPAIFSDNRSRTSELSNEPLQIWVGTEVDVVTLGGDITGTPELYQTLDYILAGVHHYHLPWVEGPDLEKSPTDILYFAHQNLIHTIRNPWVDAVGHPYVGVFKVFHYEYASLQREWIEEAGYEAKKHETALEIPVWALFKDGVRDEEYLEHVVRPLIRSGCPLSTGSDAHHLPNIGRRIDMLTEVLVQEGAILQQLWSPIQKKKAVRK